MMHKRCRVFNLLGDGSNLTEYNQSWRYQKALMEDMHRTKQCGSTTMSDALILLQHPHVFTLGRGADKKYLLNPTLLANAVRVERGGEVSGRNDSNDGLAISMID
jgi:lipoyl(octanoyl) transferase